MSDPMQEIRASFFVECEELLEALQDGLQAMDEGSADDETINVVFRAVHSIKGGAGAFGLDTLVGFTHAFETVLDGVRAGSLGTSPDVLALFFRSGDILSDLVRAARDETEVNAAEMDAALAKLDALSGGDGGSADVGEPTFEPMAIAIDLPDIGDETPVLSTDPEDASPDEDDSAMDLAGDDAPGPIRYVIDFAPEAAFYTNGGEPLSLMRQLGSIGEITVTCDDSALTDLAAARASAGLLKWRASLVTDVEIGQVRDVFEFAEGVATLDIVEGIGGDDADEANRAVDPVEVTGPEAPETEPARMEAPPAVGPASPPETAPPEPTAQMSPKTSDPASNNQLQSGPKPTVRVDLDRIDRLVNLVGELVINQAMLSQSVASAGVSTHSEVAAGLDEFLQLTRDIQDSVMMIRAQPVKSLFQRMARIVRESSATLGKSVRFRTEGETTEIDKTVLERLADPLTHMIRNAVDHGLESHDQRRAAGKGIEGTVTLSASHKAGRVNIVVADDGGGINRPKVQSIAEDKGLIPAGQTLSASEIDNLLFLPGFSTATEVSNLSGRGVGMDVVKSAISALGGRISIASEPGVGTTFTISLPLTLAVLDGMVVRVGNEMLVVPLSTISETLALGTDDIRPVGADTSVVHVRGSFVPLFDLGTMLGYSAPRDSFAGAISLLIAREDGSRAALIVDAIEDQRQVVIKGLEDSYGRVPGVAAATILGDGQIALILDPNDLLTHSNPGAVPSAARLRASA
ncbi:MAG: chemotaxis protein CheA [Pseudomonadota bacterium]